MRAPVFGLLLAAALGSIAPADVLAADSAADPGMAPGRVRVWLHGGFVPGARDFTGTQTFTEFAEVGRIESQYRENAGPGFELGVGVRLRPRLGLTVAGALGHRDGAGSFSATLPHPLYFGVSRHVSGDFGGSAQRETAVHLDVALLGGSGRLQWSAFAGPSVIGLRADLVQRVSYTQAYPYDTVTVTGAPLAATRGHAFGVNLGASAHWRVARHVALGTQARFSRATVSLEPTADDRVDIQAGGLHLTGGLRFDF